MAARIPMFKNEVRAPKGRWIDRAHERALFLTGREPVSVRLRADWIATALAVAEGLGGLMALQALEAQKVASCVAEGLEGLFATCELLRELAEEEALVASITGEMFSRACSQVARGEFPERPEFRAVRKAARSSLVTKVTSAMVLRWEESDVFAPRSASSLTAWAIEEALRGLAEEAAYAAQLRGMCAQMRRLAA